MLREEIKRGNYMKNFKTPDLILTKEEREKYPYLKTKTELKKEKLMPSPRCKPRAVYTWSGLYRGSCFLYDENTTVPYKPSKAEVEKRKIQQRRNRNYKQHKKFVEEARARHDILANKISPIPGRKVVFDIETTGLDPFTDEIVKVSAVDQDGNVLIDEYVKPLWNVDWPKAESIHHITPKMVKNAKTIEQLWEELETIFLSAEELIAYNFDFDFAFLREAGVTFPPTTRAIRTDVMLDFAIEYGEEFRGSYKYQKLTKAATYYGYEFQAHDSLEDAKATLYVHQKLQKNCQKIIVNE